MAVFGRWLFKPHRIIRYHRVAYACTGQAIIRRAYNDISLPSASSVLPIMYWRHCRLCPAIIHVHCHTQPAALCSYNASIFVFLPLWLICTEFHNYFTPIGKQSIVMSMPVCACLCVCVFVCPLSYLRNYTRPIFAKIFVHVTYGRGSVLLWQRSDMLCTSGFIDDVIFAHKPRLLDVAA